MKVSLIKRPALMVGLVVSITFLIVIVSPSRFVAPAGAQQSTSIAPAIPMPAPGSVYRQTNLVSDIPGFAPVLDPLLVNPWGISITGNITGWNPNAPAAGSTTAVIAASHAAHVYTGLAIGSNSGGNRLYAADFRNNHIDVFNGTFADTTVSGGFVDPTIPAGFSV